MNRDRRTCAIVLRRTDYGEADRILQLLTPGGKKSVIARGVRREKSKLAGGIEMFSVSDVTIHEGRGELGILTSAKLIEFYDELIKNIELIEMGGMMMRAVCAKAEYVDSDEFYSLLQQSFRVMQKNAKEPSCEGWKDILRAWWGINLVRAAGEDINLRADTSGERLQLTQRYYWDEEAAALSKADKGKISADHIKLMRLMCSAPAEMSLRVTGANLLIDEILYVVRCLEKATKL